MAAQSIFYHLYNQVSYMSLDQISPLTFSVGNTMKRVSVIVSSIIIFHTPVQPINALGAAIAILGTFLYSQVHLHLTYLNWILGNLKKVSLKGPQCLVICDTYRQRHPLFVFSFLLPLVSVRTGKLKNGPLVSSKVT